MPEDFGAQTKTPDGDNDEPRATARASYWPAVAGCIFVLVVGGLLLRSMSIGVPITEPRSLTAMAALVVLGLALLISAFRRRGAGRPVQAMAIVGATTVVVVVGLVAVSSSKAVLKWHVGNARSELDSAAERLLNSAPPVQPEALEQGRATRPIVTDVPRQIAGFDVTDVAVTSDGSHTWLDVAVGVNSSGVISADCRGLTYAPGFHPFALGRYEHLEGDWYWHEWTCFSI